jgi:tetratricopeptide (TPR) repeat protein
MLGASCLENQLYELSVAYYEEAIPWRQRTAPRRGIGDGTLSGYYDGLARAYAGLKNTPKAVEAAVGAIVSWGPTHSNRANALEALNHVLRQAPDLDAYVAQLDKQAVETKQENPLVRKAAGRAYFEKQQYAKATSQLRIAAEVQPNDKETHELLVQSYDKQNDKAGAIGQILAAVELSRRDLALYRDLGRRLAALNQPQEAERAYTSIVEALPSESESHAMLAEARQEQDRWGEALQRWQQVARIRSLEPTGLIKLAQAQIKLEQWEEARGTLEKLEKTSWPQRFQNELNEVRRLKTQVERRSSN